MSGRDRWLLRALPISLVYVAIGLTTAALSRSASSARALTAWRLAAWIGSGGVFMAQLLYERYRVRAPRAAGALHAAAAVAGGALLLAFIATARQAMGGTIRGAMILALVIWPVATGVVSWLVGVAIGALLPRPGDVRPEA